MRARIPGALRLLAALALLPGATALAQDKPQPEAQTQAPAQPPAQPTQPSTQLTQPPTSTEPPLATPERPPLQLTLDEAVKRALENNNDIVVARYNPELSQQNVLSARGYYDPYLFSNLSHSSQNQPGTSAISGGATVNTKRDVWNFGAADYIPTGGAFQLTFNNYRQNTNNVLASFNPLFNSNFSLSLTQPLLRNLLIDQPRQQLRIAKKNREISDVQFHATIVNTVANVKGYYYDLIYAFDNLEAARRSLDLAKRLLNENEIRVKVGTMAPLDVVTAQAEVAAREVDVITAENNLAQAQDNLKQAIFPANDAVMWATQIVPVDRPGADAVPVDVDAAVRNALQNRTDVVAARKNLEISDYALQYARNQLLPQFDLTASYGTVGAGGTQLVRDPPFGGPVVSTVPGGYGDALSQVFGRDFPTWTVGANLSYSIPNRSYRAAATSARISKDQALASFRRLELQVAADVRTAARGVESGFKTVTSSTASRVLAEQRLDAEEKKFAAGMSTNYLVTQAQRDLALARVTELRAISNYRKSIVNFQRVQEAGLTAGTTGSAILSSPSQQSSAARSAAAAGSSGGGGF